MISLRITQGALILIKSKYPVMSPHFKFSDDVDFSLVGEAVLLDGRSIEGKPYAVEIHRQGKIKVKTDCRFLEIEFGVERRIAEGIIQSIVNFLSVRFEK